MTQRNWTSILNVLIWWSIQFAFLSRIMVTLIHVIPAAFLILNNENSSIFNLAQNLTLSKKSVSKVSSKAFWPFTVKTIENFEEGTVDYEGTAQMETTVVGPPGQTSWLCSYTHKYVQHLVLLRLSKLTEQLNLIVFYFQPELCNAIGKEISTYVKNKTKPTQT